MIRLSDIRGNQVLSTAAATTVGKVAGIVIDPELRRVVALQVKKSKGPGDILLWDRITAIGPDAVTVESEERITDPPGDLEDRLAADIDLGLVGHRVLTDHGRELGTVRDVEFDHDGTVATLMLKDVYVEGSRLLGIGPYAVVVRS